MSSLPPVFVNGNILDASELNLMRSARNGDLTPIDEVTNNEIDDTYDLGTPISRWRDGHFSGSIQAEGQNILVANAVTAIVGPNIMHTVSWNAPITNVGTAISPDGVQDFKINEAGIYMINLTLDYDGFVFASVEIRQERPKNTPFNTTGGSDGATGDFGPTVQKNENTLMVCQANDNIKIRLISKLGFNLRNGSRIYILKMY